VLCLAQGADARSSSKALAAVVIRLDGPLEGTNVRSVRAGRHAGFMGRPVGSTSGREPGNGYPTVSSELGGFLAGFIEGEGSFGIQKQPGGSNYRCA
jgi:hypothetical protein